MTVGGTTDKGTIKIDGSKKLKQLDIAGSEGPNRGKTFLCIYELKDDTLTVCYSLDFKTRPTEMIQIFVTKPRSPSARRCAFSAMEIQSETATNSPHAMY